MADKKLSEFNVAQESDVSDLVVLYLDENNTKKNGLLPFSTFASKFALLNGSNTFLGANTFSGNTVFSGNVTFNQTVNANISGSSASCSGNSATATTATTATTAVNDTDGNNIASTYAKKDASNFTQAGKNTIIGLDRPDYSKGYPLIKVANFENNIPALGWVLFNADYIYGNDVAYLKYSSTGTPYQMAACHNYMNSYYDGSHNIVPVDVGNVVYNTTGLIDMTFFPCKGTDWTPPTPPTPTISYYCYRTYDFGRYWYYYSENLYTNVIPEGTTLYYTSNVDVASDSSDLTSSLITQGSMNVERYSAGDLAAS